MAHITANGKKHEIPAGATAEETFESLKMACPELSNAKLEKDGSNWKATTSYGKKG